MGERLRDRVAAASRAGLGVDDYAREVLELVRVAVPFESACLATTDPTTRLLTGTTKIDLPDARDADFARHEYEIDDVNTFIEIAARDDPVGVLALDTDGHPEVSARYRDFLVPFFDQGQELRIAFRSRGRTWGILGLYRPTRGMGFSVAEADYLGRLSSVIAEGLRGALVAAQATRRPGPDGPAVIIVGGDGEVRSASGAAEERITQLGGSLWGALPMSVRSVVGAARAVAAGRGLRMPKVRVRTADGGWVAVHGSPLAGPDGTAGDIVVTLDEARAPDVVPLVVEAYGLTGREREVVALMLRGESTARIAEALHLSPYTVQDHFTSIFDKAGVRSRRELAAAVFFDQYAPRIGDPLGADGFFAGE